MPWLVGKALCALGFHRWRAMNATKKDSISWVSLKPIWVYDWTCVRKECQVEALEASKLAREESMATRLLEDLGE